MAYDRSNRSRSSSDRLRSSRQGSGTSLRSGSGSRSRSSSSGRRRSTSGRSNGYTIQHKNVRFNDRRGFFDRLMSLDRATILLLLAAIIIMILLVIGISSCVRSCVANSKAEDAEKAEPAVATGISDDLTNELNEMLTRNEQLEWIAEHANEYADERIVQLALDEPTAVSFVRNLPDAEKTSSAYDGDVTKGSVPQLYDWDTRWGYIDYGELPLGVLGSGPTCMSMAYMGVSGLADQSPADFAQMAIDGGYATGDDGTSVDFFAAAGEELGLTVAVYDPSEETMLSLLGETSYVIVELQANTLTDYAHYALVVKVNDDGSVVVHDPTSTSVTSHDWDPATIVASSSKMIQVSAGEDSGW